MVLPVPESCLTRTGDVGKAISVGTDGNEKASAAAAASLTWLIGGNLEPYDDELDPSKLLFNLEIYAKANCKNIRIHTRNHVL